MRRTLSAISLAITGILTAAVGLAGGVLLAPAALADQVVGNTSQVFTTVGNESVAYKGYTYFAANDGVRGNELWRSNGTAAGTTLVKDFYVANALSHSNPTQLTVAGNRLYVNVQNGPDNVLWYTENGSTFTKISYSNGDPGHGVYVAGALGARLIVWGYTYATGFTLFRVDQGTDVAAPIYSSVGTAANGNNAVIMGDYLYYAGLDHLDGGSSLYGSELWRTDGTAAGTTLVRDIHTGNSSSSPMDLVATSNRVYFTADDGFAGREVWSTDGTSAGTHLLRDHRPGLTSGNARALTPVGNVLYYNVDDYTTGMEVWRSEGTQASTRLVKDIAAGVDGSGETQLFTWGGALGFFHLDNLWRSNGTAAGTVVVQAAAGMDGYGPLYPTAVGSTLYFRAPSATVGGVLWRSNGTPSGTFPLSALGLGLPAASGSHADLGKPFVLGNKLIVASRFKQASPSPYQASDKRLYFVDRTKLDQPRRITQAARIKGAGTANSRLDAVAPKVSVPAERLTYQWKVGGKAVKNGTAAYLWVTDAHVGKTVTVTVTAFGQGGQTVSSTAKGVKITGVLTRTSAAAVKGTARVGKKLSVKKPKFAVKRVKITYQWFVGKKKIKGAKKATIKLTSKYRGKKLTVKVTVKKAGFKTVTYKLTSKRIAKR